MVHWSGRLRIWTEPESKQGWYIGQDLYWAFFFSSLVSCLFNLILVRSEKRSWIQVFGRVRRSDAGVTLKAQGAAWDWSSCKALQWFPPFLLYFFLTIFSLSSFLYVDGEGEPTLQEFVRLWVHANIKAFKTCTALADIGSDNGFGGEILFGLGGIWEDATEETRAMRFLLSGF
ncbi:hypothetical protein AGABI1DRAFT_105373 [Agaricus bisporus var. burnettii JB137-S8]|uniref:Uncharacterized protein n=1 Tax=Agaricus bisporus var. burnettii (strain JB137-S8 / ATCC MYA-4627 / FGSC 10392) TaxID=597362 RepID=K5XFH5_AGABU|nr:uncharacterized protein AGABI1DRAFT_105373 [Agaricus bisporus var. burnettii JB137-S8]EKM81987.1 hypothetical protein AGABI1DRAFT_105373 [Agaricus bisporus var. burnettii JB137-S8]